MERQILQTHQISLQEVQEEVREEKLNERDVLEQEPQVVLPMGSL